jgi:hypothetical protein
MYKKYIRLQACQVLFELQIESNCLFLSIENAFSYLFCDEYNNDITNIKKISVYTTSERTNIHLNDVLYLSCEKDNLEIVLSTIIDIISDSLEFYPDDYSFYHSFVVSKDTEAILFIAPTHQGKTTIGTALTLNGYMYVSDDIAVFNENGQLIPFCLPIKLRKTELLCKTDLSNKYHIISTKNYDFLIPHQNIFGRFSPRKVVFLKREHNSKNAVNVLKLDGFDALHRLIKNASYCRSILSHTLSSKRIVQNCHEFLEITYTSGLEVLKYI